MTDPLIIAKTNDHELALLPAMSNRHGCITGATGTGKTVTLQKLAESFSSIGVPVFMATSSDLSEFVDQGTYRKMKKRLDMLQIDTPSWQGCQSHCGMSYKNGHRFARLFRYGAVTAGTTIEPQ
jgi:hypothetical protein